MANDTQEASDQKTSVATIDPPAADTAKRARERREALLRRLIEENEFRVTQKKHLDELLSIHDADMQNAKFQTSVIPIA